MRIKTFLQTGVVAKNDQIQRKGVRTFSWTDYAINP